MDLDLKMAEGTDPEYRTVVRLRTSFYKTKNGMRKCVDINTLKRKSYGFDILDEEVSNMGVDYAFERIINLNECEDGLYEVVGVNISRDWETGYIDDYDLELVQFNEEGK